MENIERLNKVFEYIECSLQKDIDMQEVSRIMCENRQSSERIFKFITGSTVREYFKSRKMSMAAIALCKKGAKVVDVATSFGYTSSQAFARAFRSFFGFSPSEIKGKHSTLKLFPPFSATIELDHEILNFKISQQKELPLFVQSIVIAEDEDTGASARAFWNGFDKSKLSRPYFGFAALTKKGEEYFVASSTPFGGSREYIFPASKFAIFTFNRDVIESEKISKILNYWINESGLAINAHIPQLEKYNPSTLEIFLPLQEK